jgi:predicted DNA binding protein
MDSELFCRSCLFTSKSNADGTAEWTLAFPDGRSLTRFLKRLEKDDISVDIRRLSKVLDRKNLTPRQQQIIQHALDRGYFDYPRRIDLSNLAGELKVSKSTLGEILRRGEKKALSSLYGQDADRFSAIPAQ